MAVSALQLGKGEDEGIEPRVAFAPSGGLSGGQEQHYVHTCMREGYTYLVLRGHGDYKHS